MSKTTEENGRDLVYSDICGPKIALLLEEFLDYFVFIGDCSKELAVSPPARECDDDSWTFKLFLKAERHTMKRLTGFPGDWGMKNLGKNTTFQITKMLPNTISCAVYDRVVRCSKRLNRAWKRLIEKFQTILSLARKSGPRSLKLQFSLIEALSLPIYRAP